MSRILIILTVVICSGALCGAQLHAQSSTVLLSRSVVSAGAVLATNGSITLRGTVGELATGVSGGSNIDLSAGFWYTPLILTSVPGEGDAFPASFSLRAYPNPFAATVNLHYTLSSFSDVRVTVYNLAGKTVTEFNRSQQAPGTYVFEWNGKHASGASAPAGLYIVQMRARTAAGEVRTLTANLIRTSK